MALTTGVHQPIQGESPTAQTHPVQLAGRQLKLGVDGHQGTHQEGILVHVQAVHAPIDAQGVRIGIPWL